MVTVAIMAAVMAMVAPAFTGIKNAGDITKAAYDVAGVFENARAYATANNTYVWVGFYEEDASKLSTVPATVGNGRVVLSVVASKDGTLVYDPNSASNPTWINPAQLIQVGKLVKIENAHLAALPIGNGTGATLDTRPVVDTQNARYGEINAASSYPATDAKFRFFYPLSSVTNNNAQYQFSKTLRFNPRGEAVVNSTYSPQTTLEVGLQPTHGTSVDAANHNVAAVQISGMLGNVKIYRR